MIKLSIDVKNVDQLRSNFNRAPQITLEYLARAVRASIFEIEKQAVDQNFQFKTPRALRTGNLRLSFKHGMQFADSGLRGMIGPTVYYAPWVYFGIRRGQKPNPYMDRIARAAEPNVQKHFEAAAEKITDEIARI